ncbi:MAG TPA: helix-turn-helix domain-containing protein [Gaiellaceae bacterium]|nr:helix-turn-helix domain-containing protein [Gaiellaceae bacterium]
MSSPESRTSWTFLTNHTQVLLCLAQDPDVRLRDVAQSIGITERAAQRILSDLVKAGYVRTEKVGRRNRYTIEKEHAMRHVAQAGYQIGSLLDTLS